MLGTAIGVGAPALAVAQDADDDSTAWLIEEIIVTARKREEGLQSTPISISAFSGASLEYRGVTKIDGIANFTPNLVFENNPSFGGASNAAVIYIRGIGQKEFLPTTEPGVGLYVDGVYIARSVGAILDLIDIERVEVLRGPQGTLFGRNTIGGAILITTKKPDEETSGRASITYGTDNRFDIKGSVNVPFSETFFVSLAAARLNQDGYLKRDDGIDLGDDDTLTGRAAFRWLASEELEISFSVEGTRDRENGPALDLIGIDKGEVINPATGLVDPNTPPFALIHNQIASFLAGWPAPNLGDPSAYPPCVFLEGAIPGVPSTINPAVPACYDDRYIRRDGTDGGTAAAFSNNNIWGLNFTVDWALSDSVDIKSVTSYRALEAHFARDGDHSPNSIASYVDNMDLDQFTQEFQVAGTGFENKLNWILGFYYFEESGVNENLLDFTISAFRSGGHIDNTAVAGFAQGSYDVTDALSLTAGLRYTDEKKKFKPDQIIFLNKFAGTGHPLLDAPFMQAGEPILPNIEKKISIDELTPMVNLSYSWNDDLMTYLTYSEGFKSGGFTQRVFPPIVAGFTAPAGTPDIDLIPTFDPEFVKVYEFGFKYATADGRLRLNGAVFRTEYDDLQVQVFTSVAPVTKNAASATITGFEIEMIAAPAAGWLVEASVGYLDAEYDKIDELETRIFANNSFERIPKWSLSGSVSKEFPLDGLGTLTPRVDWSYRTRTYNDSFNVPQLSTPGYHMVNANFTFSSDSGNFDVVAAVSNLTDKEYMITGVWGAAMQAIEGMFHRGREWSVTLRGRF